MTHNVPKTNEQNLHVMRICFKDKRTRVKRKRKRKESMSEGIAGCVGSVPRVIVLEKEEN